VVKVEKFLEEQALGGRIKARVGDQDIIDLLSKIGGSTVSESKIVIARKKRVDESDDDDDSDLR
jgi:DNA-binding TFAR19-related protein (PDSD5 family)